jgi:hypothetical protein
VFVTGNVTAQYLLGSGQFLTGLPAGYSNVNAATFLASGTLTTAINTAGTVTISGGAGGAQLNLRNGGDLVCFNSDNSGSISVYCDVNAQLIVNGSMRLATSLGVGTDPSGTTGEIRATNNITAYYSSDARLKENIKDVDNALDKVCAIGSKTFDWTDDYIAEHGGEDGYFVQKSDFGVVAQDVQEVFPQAVRTREDGTLAVDYEKLSTLAFGAIKELVKRVAALEAK